MLALIGVVWLDGCAAHVFVPPTGPTVPFPGAAAAWRQATHACAGALTYAAAMGVHGRAGDQRLSGTIVGLVTAADQIRLEYHAPIGPPGFVLGGDAAQATLVLPRDKRVLTAPADQIVEAITGLRLGPRALLAILSGCVSQRRDLVDAARYGDQPEVRTADARVFLRSRDDHWEVMAGVVNGLILQYDRFEGAWPSQVRIRTEPGRAPAVSLTVDLSQINVNVPRPPATFGVSVGPDYTPLSLEQLRRAGPLGRTSAGG
jgi:outer membrane biogenesis lipoprotein LolB